MRLRDKIYPLFTMYGCFFFFFLSLSTSAQTTTIERIKAALNIGDVEAAKTVLIEQISQFEANDQLDSISNYIYWIGRVFAAGDETTMGNPTVENWLKKLSRAGVPHASLKQAYINAGEYYGFAGNNQQGYNSNLKAYKIAEEAGHTTNQLAKIQSNLATFAQRNGEITLMVAHSRKMMQLLEASPSVDYVELYYAQNMLGNAMFYRSRIDSAAYFYELAIQSVKRAEPTPKNQYYRVALLQNNISAIYNMRGNVDQAIDTMYQVIKNLENYNKLEEDQEERNKAQRLRFEAIDNLAGVYKDLGNLTRARELLEYAYQQKKTNLSPGNKGIFNSEILLGQLFHALRKDTRAVDYIKMGLRHYAETDIQDPLWQADGYYTLALIYDEKKDFDQAASYYHRADSLYTVALGGEYDQIYLDFLRNKSTFHLDQGRPELANEIARKSYQYVVEAQGSESLEAFYQKLILSDIAFREKKYTRAFTLADEGLSLLQKKMSSAMTLGDSVKMQLQSPKAILYKLRAKYEADPSPSKENTEALLNELYQAVDLIERKKEFVHDPENNRIILAENKELFDFIKRLELALYQMTNDEQYLLRLTNLQESILYSKIRSRLNEDRNIKYADVPASVIEQEEKLMVEVDRALDGEQSLIALKTHGEALKNLSEFRQKIKKNYPRYYDLKYRSFLSEPIHLEKVQKENTTILRYFYIDTSLYVLVLNENHKGIFQLQNSGVEGYINSIQNPEEKEEKVLEAMHELYRILWLPFAEKVTNKKVVIIPAGVLYSLNMEILTPTKIRTFKELGTKSLLSQYVFSYQYTLYHNHNQLEGTDKKQNWVGFAPGFSSDIKMIYAQSVEDSIMLDQTYMRLLPQPFTTSLVKKMAKGTGGKAFLNEASTRNNFLNINGHTTVLHVGSHAFSDNENPQYSRIVFVKEGAADRDNNLYVHHLYNRNISTDLAILSACGTGRPGYEDGEGMISLAHAFYYAGSKSMMTSLWETDERSTNMILEYFYKNLQAGMDKDEAVRQAKLSYIGQEEGRILAPIYWSGLVLMGDITPVDLLSGGIMQNKWILAGIIIFSLAMIGLLIWNLKIKPRQRSV